MSDNPLLSCWLKIDRAKQHFDDLNRTIRVFADTDPHRIIVDDDTEPAIKIYKIGIREPTPDTWSPIIGTPSTTL